MCLPEIGGLGVLYVDELDSYVKPTHLSGLRGDSVGIW